MFGFHVRTRQSAANSPRTPSRGPAAGSPAGPAPGSPRTPRSPSTAVGEIDTRAPFQSVRAAVNMFGDTISPRTAKPVVKKTKTSEERVLEKETQLHWTLKELDKFKERLRNAETTKVQAFRELEKANRTLLELTNKLENVSESKHAAIEAMEAAKIRVKELEEVKSRKNQMGNDDAWKDDVDSEREQYRASANELNLAKQELTNLKQDFDAALEIKLAAFQQAADAQHVAKVNREKLADLSKEVSDMRVTLERVRLASANAEDEHLKAMSEREVRVQHSRTAKEETEMKIQTIMREAKSPDADLNLEDMLDETTEAIKVVQEQLKNAHAADIESLESASSELDSSMIRMQEMIEEESKLRGLVESLKADVENMQKEISGSSENELLSQKLQLELDKTKAELKEAIAGKTEAESGVKELESKLQELSSEAENAKQEEDYAHRQLEAIKLETKSWQLEEKDAEAKLEIAMKEVEQAKAAEDLANDQMHNRSARKESSDSAHSGKIRLTPEEFESLSRKVEEVSVDADVKVATAMAQVESIKAKELLVLEKLERSLEEAKEVENAIIDAIKMAEMADAAKVVIEGELQKWQDMEKDEIEEEEPSLIREDN